MPRRRLGHDDPTPNPATTPIVDDPFADEVPAPPEVKRRPCTARVWLSPVGYLCVEFPYDKPSIDFVKSLLPGPVRWNAAYRVWTMLPEHLGAVRTFLSGRFETVSVDPDAIPYVERRAKAVRRATVSQVVEQAERPEGEATVFDLSAFRRGGGAA